MTTPSLLTTTNSLIYLILGATLLYDLLQGHWSNVFMLVVACILVSIPMLLQRFYAVTIPPVMETSLVVFVFTTIFLGEIQQFYDTLWWWDTVLHALAGFGLTLIGHILLGVIHREAGSRPLPMVLTLFAFTFALGVSALWEVYEFAVDSLSTMTNMQPSGEDTMWDIISATVAALPASYIGWKWWHRARNTAAETDAVSQVIDDGVDGFSGGTMK